MIARKPIFASLLAAIFLPILVQAQTTQSIIYESIAMMNARTGVNAILIPANRGYNVVEPISGNTVATAVAAIPGQYTDATKSQQLMLDILARNVSPALPAGSTLAQVTAAYNGNPFFATLIPAAHAAVAHAADLSSVASVPGSSASGGLSGVNLLDNLANGLGDFLIKRAEEELSTAVFSKLQDFLVHYPELDTLFPQTCAMIKQIAAYDYPKSLDAFKASVNNDLQNLVPRIGLLYNIPRYQLLNQKVPALSLAFVSSTVISDIDGKKGFGQSLKDIISQPYMTADNNYISLIKAVRYISGSFQDKLMVQPDNTSFQYIRSDLINMVVHQDPTHLTYLAQAYLCLLWQKADPAVTFKVNGNTYTIRQLLSNWTIATANTAFSQLNNVVSSVALADSSLLQIKKQEVQDNQFTGKGTKKIDRYPLYANLISEGLSMAALLSGPAASPFGTRITQISQYFPTFSNSMIAMVRDFQQQQYALAIQELDKSLRLVASYLDDLKSGPKADKKTVVQSVSNQITADSTAIESSINSIQTALRTLPATVGGAANDDVLAQKQEMTDRIADLHSQLKNLKWQRKNASDLLFSISKVLDYVSLLASAANAQNADAIESLLETYALPAGSSRVKKVTSWNFAANAWVGAFWRPNPSGKGFTNSYGFTAPIGVALSWGMNSGGSISLLGQILDVGGIIQYKLNNEGAYEQNINLVGLISPGVHIVYGFPAYLPLSLGIGCQWISPSTSVTNNISLSPFFNVFLGVDIPFFNITAGRKHKAG